VQHIWSRYQSEAGWIDTDAIPFPIAGGREGGYRGVTRKRSISAGTWRVEVRTENGQILGRIHFEVRPSPVPHPQLVTRVIQ
jgi:hypothetical protein